MKNRKKKNAEEVFINPLWYKDNIAPLIISQEFFEEQEEDLINNYNINNK